VHSAASTHIASFSTLEQNDQVRGELPVQHPLPPYVGAGGSVNDGGSVGGEHSSGSSPSIHEHTPADSHSAPLSNSLQNENVRAEYPVQQPSTEYVGDGGAVVVVNSHSDGSSVTMNSQFEFASHALLLSSMAEQNVFVDGVDP